MSVSNFAVSQPLVSVMIDLDCVIISGTVTISFGDKRTGKYGARHFKKKYLNQTLQKANISIVGNLVRSRENLRMFIKRIV